MAASKCCGDKAKCVRCACSKHERACSDCLAGRRGGCRNPFGRGTGLSDRLSKSASSPRGSSPLRDSDLSHNRRS